MCFIIRVCLLASSLILMSGCSLTSLMFYPLKQFPATPDQLGMEYETIHHQASDGTQLVSWWLPANLQLGETPKGSVVFLHGNAQNISYHQFNLNWLPRQGYNVFLLGYRQFGESDGIAKLPNVFLDVHSALDWVHGETPNIPLIMLGQSMGASLAVFGLASYDNRDAIDAVVLDAAFDSYPGMAATAMSRNWLTWPLQLPANLITDEYDPIDWIQDWPTLPLLMLHSPEDRVVPYEKGQALFKAASEPKKWVENKGPHIATFRYEEMRREVLGFIDAMTLSRSN